MRIFKGTFDTEKRSFFAIPVAVFAAVKWRWQIGDCNNLETNLKNRNYSVPLFEKEGLGEIF